MKIGTRTHHHQCKRKRKQTNIPVEVVIQIQIGQMRLWFERCDIIDRYMWLFKFVSCHYYNFALL